jgi:AcrR family transcriptional regulator
MPSSATPYHHGDLRAACVRAALELLEEGGTSSEFSMRAVARKAGVAPAAPYRHYADRDALMTAVATVGYTELAKHLAKANPAPTTASDLADVAVAYVDFAVRRSALFSVMFAEPCDQAGPDRIAATDAISAYVADIVSRCFPDSNSEALATAIWALVHGLAFLHLDGKLDTSSALAVEGTVRAAVHAVLGLANTSVTLGT